MTLFIAYCIQPPADGMLVICVSHICIPLNNFVNSPYSILQKESMKIKAVKGS